MGKHPPREFSFGEGLAMCLGMIGIQLMSEVLAVFGTAFYSPPAGSGRTIYIASVGFVGLIFFIGTIFDAITDPLIGAWSDHTRPTPTWRRLLRIGGRRRPFIFWGAALMAVTSILFWYPPIAGTSWMNVVYGTAIICLHWLFFTMAAVPLNALGPEIARSERERVRLGQWIAVGMILGLAIANIAPGELMLALADSPDAEVTATNVSSKAETESLLAQIEEPQAISPVGARRTAAILAAISFAAFLCPVFFVRERFDATHAKPSTPPMREIFGTLRNRVFLFYFASFCIFMTGYLAAQRVLVHWSIVGLNGDEGTVASLMLPFILTAVISATVVAPLLSRWITPKWLLFFSFAIIATGLPLMWPIGTLDASSETKIRLGALLFAYTGIGQGIQYVVIWPLIGQVIDLDERQTGERREAVYQGMSGIAFKFGQAAAIIIATQSMTWFGYSAEEPWGIYMAGPIAGAIGIAGLIVVWYYPELHRNNAAEVGVQS